MHVARPQPIDRVLSPLREFTGNAASSGVVLMAAALIALLWANAPFGGSYAELWETKLTVGIGELGLSKPLHLWINDGLMAVFFLVVGLEIKREVLIGELASVRRAILPLAAALGGAVLPALIFLALNAGHPEERGWGVPMATDIAFALGVLALLGSRAPAGLRLFLTALAIADDLFAVVVIALFYTSDLAMGALLAAGVVLVLLVVANLLGVRHALVYAVLGVALWLAVLQSGVHATIAGVLLAFAIPARTRVDPDEFALLARRAVADYEGDGGAAPDVEARNAALWDLESATEKAQAPMQRFEHALNPWVSFAIVPLFALANAGVRVVDADLGALLGSPLTLGIVLGLVLGKQIGITAATWLVVRSGRAELPAGVAMRHIYGVAWLGGIGFTMSLFIAELAFVRPELLDAAKVGILAASAVAGTGGYLLLRRLGPVEVRAR